METRPVKGFESIYFVTEDGQVMSRWEDPKGKPLSPDRNGRVLLYTGQGRSGGHQVSHLVLEAFDRPRPNPRTPVVHIDGNRRNCALSNLAWKRALTMDDHESVVEAYAEGMTRHELAERYGVSESVIYRVVYAHDNKICLNTACSKPTFSTGFYCEKHVNRTWAVKRIKQLEEAHVQTQ